MLAHRREQHAGQRVEFDRVRAGGGDQLAEMADPAALQGLGPVSKGAQFGVDIGGLRMPVGSWPWRSTAALQLLTVYSIYIHAWLVRSHPDGPAAPEGRLIRRSDVRLEDEAPLMAIYHFSAKVISRAGGSSAVAAAAYRSASRLHDERLDRPHDFTNKAGVVHSEILLPEGAPERWRDRATLWNEVEAA